MCMLVAAYYKVACAGSVEKAGEKSGVATQKKVKRLERTVKADVYVRT